jgi:hypothetical protein
VAYLFKARIVEPEKLPLLSNGSETTFVSRQRLCIHVPAATDTYATIEVMLETMFSTRSVQRGYNVREAVKKRDRRKEAVGREPPFGEDLRSEAED